MMFRHPLLIQSCIQCLLDKIPLNIHQASNPIAVLVNVIGIKYRFVSYHNLYHILFFPITSLSRTPASSLPQFTARLLAHLTFFIYDSISHSYS